MAAPKVRAFAVSCVGFDTGIYFRESADKAKIAALLEARNAGYKGMKFSDLRVKRATEFDGATYCGETPKHGVIPDLLDVVREVLS